MFLSVRCSVTFTQLQHNQMYHVKEIKHVWVDSSVFRFTCAGTSGSAALSVLYMNSQLSSESPSPTGSNQTWTQSQHKHRKMYMLITHITCISANLWGNSDFRESKPLQQYELFNNYSLDHILLPVNLLYTWVTLCLHGDTRQTFHFISVILKVPFCFLCFNITFILLWRWRPCY